MEEFCAQFNIPHSQTTLTLQDAILITSTSPQQDVNSISDLPRYMLNRIMMLDCNSRQLPRSILAAAGESQKKNIFTNFLKLESQSKSEVERNPVNPMDIFLFLFIKCDPIFRQTFVTQVSKCQLSIPLITSYPSGQNPTFYLFALKTLYKDYIKEDNTSTSFSVTEEKISIISFIRVGTCGKSQKSEMLNEILGTSGYFFNRNQLGNTKKRYFLDGTVEIAWLFPKYDQAIEEQRLKLEPYVILNLRGDAFSYPNQCNFIASISSLVYVFVPINQCDKLMSDKLVALEKDIASKSTSVYLLYDGDPAKIPVSQDERHCPDFLNSEESFILLQKNSLGEDCDIIKDNISSFSQKIQNFRTSFNDCIHIAKKLSFKIDIEECNIMACESFVESILHRLLNPIEDANGKCLMPGILAAAKKRMLPLQGECWSKWADANRELHHFLGFTDNNEAEAVIVKSMTEARQIQIGILKHPSSFLTDILQHCKSYGKIRGDFYLTWKLLQNDFNSLSKTYLPVLYDEYKKCHQISCSSQSRNGGEEIESTNNSSLIQAAKNIAESSLGIEHVFRELGQVFEAYKSSKQRKNLERTLSFPIRILDEISANLIVEGHAFEILDGDVNHVPIEWVTHVLECLSLKIGFDKRIFVLSILGTQSTGKSTLLNTMFGANFPVSSGRCTRGIFMHLIPIEESLRSQLRYDYLVLLDTEGLRAPELSVNSYRRDNELATFVIGLGDATVINMSGEGHSDVQDILQIIVFAFIRMKETYSKPRCMFVHQNVPDTNAHTNLLTARSNLIKTLDKMTVCAAQQENQVAIYKQFCDVIEFNPEEEVFYFPGLFEGEPPLNRIAPAYAKKATKLREYILNRFSNVSEKHFLTVEEWSVKLNSLWKSILQENFIFSYKNALEVTARFELDHELSCWHSKYIQAMSNWKSESINLLFNADLDEVEGTLENLKSDLRQELINPRIESKSEEMLVKSFFSDHLKVDIMTQWKANTTMHIGKQRETLIEEMKREYTMIYKVQRTKKEMDHKFSKCRKQIISKVNSLFIEMKDQGRSLQDKSLVESSFLSIWNEWKSQIEVDEIKTNDICKDLQIALFDSPIIKSMNVLSGKSDLLRDSSRFVEIGENNFNELSRLEPASEPEYYIWSDLVKRIRKTVLFSAIFGSETRPSAGTNRFKSLLQILDTECGRCINEYLSPLSKKICPYDPNSFLIIIEKCYEILNKHNSSLQNMNLQESMQFTTDFIFDYILYQCCKAIPTLEKVQDSFISRTSLDFKFNQLECQLKDIFTRLCDGIQNEHSCALELSNITFRAMKEYLTDLVPPMYISVFRQDPKHSITYQDRASLILCILKDLAHQRNFDNYISYINSPFNFMVVFAQNQLREHFKQKNGVIDVVSNLVIEKVNSLVEFYSDESLNSCFNFQEPNSDSWRLFKTKFYYAINPKVRNLSYNDFDILDIHTISNYELFCKLYLYELNCRIKDTDWNSWIETILEGDESLYKSLTEPLMGCRALCPFCKEACQLSVGEHEHYCGTFHRPQGINGWRYVDSQVIVAIDCTNSIKNRGRFIYNDQTYEYINYKTVNENFRSWKILGDDALASKYWRWVLFTFQNNFLEYYNIISNECISNWEHLTEEEVVDDLELHYQNHLFINK